MLLWSSSASRRSTGRSQFLSGLKPRQRRHRLRPEEPHCRENEIQLHRAPRARRTNQPVIVGERPSVMSEKVAQCNDLVSARHSRPSGSWQQDRKIQVVSLVSFTSRQTNFSLSNCP